LEWEAMSEDKKKDKKKPLSLSRPGTLELNKTVETGQIRQRFSHGRSKMVTVEVRKKRVFQQDSGGHMAEIKEAAAAQPDDAPIDTDETIGEDAASRPAALHTLTSEEKAARARAIAAAQKVHADTPPSPDSTAPGELEAAALEDAQAQDAEEVGAEKTKAAASVEAKDAPREDKKDSIELGDEEKAEQSAAAAKLQDDDAGKKEVKKPRVAHPGDAEAANKKHHAKVSRKEASSRRRGKLTIVEALGGREDRSRSLAAVKRAREKHKKQSHSIETQKIIREVVVPETITVQELANRMAERRVDVIKALMKMDVLVKPDQAIDADTAELVVAEFGHNLKRVSEADVELGLKGETDDEASLQPRPPIVVVMGHVDHGKTSLLDALRQTDVVAGEAGGITQHIGAYQVEASSGAKITFVDTPGHAAFTEMRARGAKVTDIAILVVAADDGIMPQTIEAINHAKAAEVPIIVAVNKIDLEGADPARIRTDLLQHDVVVEEMGGDVLCVELSAKEKTNLEKLEEAILLQAEILDLKANPERAAEGIVVEAKLEQGRGAVATILVQNGTLGVGDIFVAGGEWGRVRAMADANRNSLDKAGPSVPVEVLGMNGISSAGDDVSVVDTEARAREVVAFRQKRERDIAASKNVRGKLEDMFESAREGDKVGELAVVIKADAHGSEEAIVAALEKMSTDEVKVQVLHSGVGSINESDITLAGVSEGLVIGFNVRATPQARAAAQSDSVEIQYYSIIYNLIDDLRNALSGLLAPTLRETFLGNAKILEVFDISKVGKIAGCMVVEGTMRRGANVRLVRDGVVIHEGSLSQLKRFKDDAKEVKEGLECGMAFEKYHDLKADDVIECFQVEKVARKLEA
jgi:translation initiation factor IF-2